MITQLEKGGYYISLFSDCEPLVTPLTGFSAIIHRLRGLFPAFAFAQRAFLSPESTHEHPCWQLDADALGKWHRWRNAFLQRPRLWAMGTPPVALRLMYWAWCLQDQAVLAAMEQLLDKQKKSSWRTMRQRISQPAAWIMVIGPDARRWQAQIKPVLHHLPEPLALFVVSAPLSGLPASFPDWQPHTQAIICRGVECSSPIARLDYLLETLRDG